MRLICPNCGAEYEVPDDVVPPAGRDVQCSACGQTWFATPEGVSPPDAAEDAPPFGDDDRLISDPDAPEPGAPEAEADPAAPVPDPGQPRPRRPLDRSVADVLQKERETSEALKRSETSGPPDAAEDESDDTARAVAAATAATAAAATGSAISRARSSAPRSDAASQLPDVDEINSTLRPEGRRSERRQRSSERAAQQTASRKRRRGFRLGFFLVALIALVAWLVYWQAPFLAETFPDLAVSLGNYVIAVDNGRIWLNETIASVTGGGEA